MIDRRALAGLLAAWATVSAVVTLWDRPGEVAAFASFCVTAGVAVVVWYRYAD